MTANLRAATVSAGVSEAAREARRADGDFGVLQDLQSGVVVRRATAQDYERHLNACDKAQDCYADFVDPSSGRRVQLVGT
jgi:hypothetical protein